MRRTSSCTGGRAVADLWPARPQYEARGAHLRTALGVNDNSPLRARDLHNALERLD